MKETEKEKQKRKERVRGKKLVNEKKAEGS